MSNLELSRLLLLYNGLVDTFPPIERGRFLEQPVHRRPHSAKQIFSKFRVRCGGGEV